MTRPARACINLSAIRSNLAHVKRLTPQSKIMAVVKANAYGHGLLPVARALQEADAFAVASLEEAITLRDAGLLTPIVLLEGFFAADELPQIIALNLMPVIHNTQQLTVLADYVGTGQIAIWLKLDSGMHRLGFPPEQLLDVYRQLKKMPVVSRLQLLSHLACADDKTSSYTSQQATVFQNCLDEINVEASLANSAAILAWPKLHYDWVRPGLMLYGISPFIEGRATDDGLQAAMELTTRLIAVHHLKSGDRIGYGGAWVCPEAMTIGIAAIGYGDGYPRHAATGTPVLVNQQRTQLLGRVSMDMIAVDLRGVSAEMGDEVVLWGAGLPVEEVAQHAGTIAYELVCGLATRITVETLEE